MDHSDLRVATMALERAGIPLPKMQDEAGALIPEAEDEVRKKAYEMLLEEDFIEAHCIRLRRNYHDFTDEDWCEVIRISGVEKVRNNMGAMMACLSRGLITEDQLMTGQLAKDPQVDLMRALTNPSGVIQHPEQKEGVVPAEEFRKRVALPILSLSRKQGRDWSTYGDVKIETDMEQFFRCSLRGNIAMTPEIQEQEINRGDQILCVGCAHSRRPLMCVGYMVRRAWHARHPNKPRYWTPT